MSRILKLKTICPLFSIWLALGQSLIAENLIVNGGFELPAISNPNFTTRPTGYNFGGNGWVVSQGTVDQKRMWQAAEGLQSIDLNGTSVGAIRQDIVTSPGLTYKIRFAMAGNYRGLGNKRMEVLWGGAQIADLTFVQSNQSASDMGWLYHEFIVVASTAVTRLSFRSLTGSLDGSAGFGPYYGAVLDDVSVVEVIPEPTITNALPYHSSYSGSSTPPWNRLDTSKTLVKEGTEPQLLTYDNLINTAQGINGIVFDIENLPDPGNLSAEDFEFQVSPQGAFEAGANPPANWSSAPAPSSITVTPGSPDRVLIEWPDQSIMNRWLRITILANEETGLAEPETYYIGHLLGETTGPENGVFTVAFADITPIRSEVGQTVDASSITDIDKNGTVSFADISAMRGNVGSQLTQISVP